LRNTQAKHSWNQIIFHYYYLPKQRIINIIQVQIFYIYFWHSTLYRTSWLTSWVKLYRLLSVSRVTASATTYFTPLRLELSFPDWSRYLTKTRFSNFGKGSHAFSTTTIFWIECLVAIFISMIPIVSTSTIFIMIFVVSWPVFKLSILCSAHWWAGRWVVWHKDLYKSNINNYFLFNILSFHISIIQTILFQYYLFILFYEKNHVQKHKGNRATARKEKQELQVRRPRGQNTKLKTFLYSANIVSRSRMVGHQQYFWDDGHQAWKSWGKKSGRSAGEKGLVFGKVNHKNARACCGWYQSLDISVESLWRIQRSAVRVLDKVYSKRKEITQIVKPFENSSESLFLVGPISKRNFDHDPSEKISEKHKIVELRITQKNSPTFEGLLGRIKRPIWDDASA